MTYGKIIKPKILMELFSRLIALQILILILPIILLVSIISLIMQGRPVFYKQERVGYDFRRFKIYKFRTMENNSGELITHYNDQRITFFGKILRKTKIDEIPQLFNILKGEMRFIGPRPEVIKYFSEHKFQFLKIVKPGISDYASIIFRDEAKILKKIGGKNPYNDLLPIKLILAEYYSYNKNFILDLKLVSITIISIIFPDFSSKKLIIPHIYEKVPKTQTFFDRYLS